MAGVSQVMLELMEHLLSSPKESRALEDVERILPFFRTRTPVFHALSKDLLVDIAQNATLKKVKRDHAIVWQGQKGESFGIILKGAASVHARKDQARVPPQDSLPIPRSNKDRVAVVGPLFGSLRLGSSFGEMLMSHDHLTYNSTIIADELTYVLLVDESLYARSFGVHKLEWENKVSFVNQSPLFRNLTPAIKNLLMENLKPLDVQFGNRFIKQGSICNSLFFVSHGWGKVIADLRLSMTQYEAMKSSSKAKGQLSGRKTACSVRAETTTTKLDPNRPLSVIERRRHRKEYGYVAIETLMRQRELPVTSTGPNDIIGDIEIIMNLPTYCASVECMENLRVYELSKYNFYQIINQRCTQTYNLIRGSVLSKLYHRAQRHKDIPLYSLLYDQASGSTAKKRKNKSMPALWSKKVLEAQTLTRLTGIARKTEPAAKIGNISRPHKATATVDNDSKESKYSSSENKSDDKQPDKKAGYRQYTVDEFRALKKKMQAQGKIAL